MPDLAGEKIGVWSSGQALVAPRMFFAPGYRSLWQTLRGVLRQAPVTLDEPKIRPELRRLRRTPGSAA